MRAHTNAKHSAYRTSQNFCNQEFLQISQIDHVGEYFGLQNIFFTCVFIHAVIQDGGLYKLLVSMKDVVLGGFIDTLNHNRASTVIV